ncbi:hypothetical protein ACNOYE_19530 [Nannocystaceae bacterium ST9]
MLALRRASIFARSRHPAAWWAATSLVLLALACDKSKPGATAEPEGEGGELGYSDASSADLAPLPPALADDDLDGIAARAETLWKLQRATRVGERVFAANVGVTTIKFIAVARIDPGGGSGEVEFWRWSDEQLADGQATAHEARRWLLVPVTFDPDTSLDPQKPEGGPDAEQERLLSALLLARGTLEQELPDARFDVYAFREQGDSAKQRQTRIYMLGSNNDSPDVELVVSDAPKRNKAPSIASRRVHLEAGKLSSLPLTTPISPPGPSTIMRARAIATATSKPTEIIDGASNTWHFDPATSTLVSGPAPKPSKKNK